jgi:hypothetical protein
VRGACHRARAAQALPARRTGDYSEQVVAVTTSATIEVKRVLYSVPARLIGERLRLHIFDDRIEAFVGAAHAVTLPRVYSVNHERARRIDYRHLIGALVRKPQAFRYSQLRDDLLPNATYRSIWQHLDSRLNHGRPANASSASSPWPRAPTASRPWARICSSEHRRGRLPSCTALESRFAPSDEAHTADRDLRAGPSVQHPLGELRPLLPAPAAMEVH